jgi:hypothetical protein
MSKVCATSIDNQPDMRHPALRSRVAGCGAPRFLAPRVKRG